MSASPHNEGGVASLTALIAQLLRSRAGIVLGEHKAAAAKRLVEQAAARIGAPSPQHYLEALRTNPNHSEWERFINAFTINHTAFFREAHHFSHLATYVKSRSHDLPPLRIWSCAASTGEEVYSIAMTLKEALGDCSNFHVLGTDIDTEALRVAAQGIYRLERIEGVSNQRCQRFFLRGKQARKGFVRVKPSLAKCVEFSHLNLIDTQWPIIKPASFDAIFCRNTLIYFDRAHQVQIVTRLVKALRPNGRLFVGHSENFVGEVSNLRLLGQTVYEKVA